MITRIGKILVMLNVTVALLLCAWAVGVFTRHIEFSADLSKSAPDTVMQVRALQEQLKPQAPRPAYGLWDELSASEAHWKGVSGNLAKVEEWRPRNQKWYEARLADLAKSAVAVKKPGHKDARVEVIRNDPDNYGLPVMVDATDKAGQPLLGKAPYLEEYKDKQAAIVNAQDDLKRYTEEDASLTARIGSVGGLRDQIAAEIDKRERVLAEQEFLKPLLVNSRVEGELLFRRRAELESRLKELRGVGVAATR
jgi:hypothetical protein